MGRREQGYRDGPTFKSVKKSKKGRKVRGERGRGPGKGKNKGGRGETSEGMDISKRTGNGNGITERHTQKEIGIASENVRMKGI